MRARLIKIGAVLGGLAALAGGGATWVAAGGDNKPSSSTTLGKSRFTETACGTYSGRGCAPANKRVDLRSPSFSNPTNITNPLFPVSRLRSVVLLGHVDGKPFRTETTLLPGSKTVTWDGRQIRVLVSQYMAYLDGRLDEVAIDRYAQADDGSVWYLGEDVFDYRDGTVAITEGSWLAGKEGPPAMIMSAKPRVGEVFRPENVIGIVFEEVEVTATRKTVAGPRGPVRGAIYTRELHLDGTFSLKTFAPGYGEFSTGSGGNLEALALAVPTDAVSGPLPAELAFLSTSATGILESARVRNWEAVSATLKRMATAWKALRKSSPPPRVANRLSDAMARLTRAVTARGSGAVAQAAVDVWQSVLDLELRYRPPAEIDAARFHLWTQQLRVHAAANDVAGVGGDVAVLEWIRDRIPQALDRAGQSEINTRLRALRAASDARNLPAAADHAARLGARVRDLAGHRRTLTAKEED